MDLISVLLNIGHLGQSESNIERVLYLSLCDRFEENDRLVAEGGEHLGCYRDRQAEW